MSPASPHVSTGPIDEAAVDALVTQAADLVAARVERSDAVSALVDAGRRDRRVLEEARNVYARRLHGNSGDLVATSALALLNRALSASGWVDPYEWKHRRKP